MSPRPRGLDPRSTLILLHSLWQAFEALPEEEREVLRWVDMRGLSAPMAARALGIHRHWITPRLFSGRLRLEQNWREALIYEVPELLGAHLHHGRQAS